MTLKQLNRLCEDAYALMDELVPGMAAVYEKAFQRAGERAVRAFESATITAAAWTPPLENTLPTGMTEEEQEEVNRHRDVVAQAIVAIFASLGLALVTREFMEAIAKRGALNFEQEILRQLRLIVADSFDGGLTAQETAARIREAFGNVGPTTAEMLAETELTALVNERSMQAAQQAASPAKPLFKVWRTVGDNRVRPAHAAAEGQTVPLDAPFSIGGFSLNYPGDPAGPLRLVARCRCRLTYTDALAASGKEATLMGMELHATKMTNSLAAGVTITIEDDTATTTTEVQPAAWRALLAIEDQPTEDGRLIAPGALSWRDLPLSLMAMDTTGPGGHEGAQVAGKILSIERDGNDILATGVFSETEFGQHIQTLVGEETLRGNSVDLAVTSYEYRNADTGEVLEGDELMDAFFGDVPIQFVVLEGVIMASTVCPTPAIAGAEIMLASGLMRMSFSFQRIEAVLTAAAAGMAPLHPPQAWFDDPVLDGPTPLTVTPDGRVYGHAALWDSCHIGEPSGPGICVPPPRSGMSYEIFHHGAVTTEEGTDVPCGQITLGTTHAGRDLTWSQTLEHYENSGVAVADVCAGEDAYGIYLAGGLRPDVPAEKVREMKAGSISGDWRSVINRGLEFIGALVVNIPGFPIPRPSAVVTASAAGEELVLSLQAAGPVPVTDEIEGMSRREYLRKIAVLTR